MVSEKTAQALHILEDHGPHGITAAEFGQTLWPDAEGHRRYHKNGNNSVARGRMMNMSAGGYLGRLRKMGFIDWENMLIIEGRKALEEYQAK